MFCLFPRPAGINVFLLGLEEWQTGYRPGNRGGNLEESSRKVATKLLTEENFLDWADVAGSESNHSLI